MSSKMSYTGTRARPIFGSGVYVLPLSLRRLVNAILSSVTGYVSRPAISLSQKEVLFADALVYRARILMLFGDFAVQGTRFMCSGYSE